MAASIFGELPTTTYEEARDHFLRARELKGEWIMNTLWLGRTYAKLKQSHLARTTLQEALSGSCRSQEDREAQAKAADDLAKL